MKKRKVKDVFRYISVYFSSIFTVIVLVGIILFVLIKGSSSFSLKLLTEDNEATVDKITVIRDDSKTYSYTPKENEYFSDIFGIAFTDSKNLLDQDVVKITYIAEASPFITATKTNGDSYKTQVGTYVDIIYGYNGTSYIDVSKESKAKGMIDVLNTLKSINFISLSTGGGGARTSFLSTLYLILITLAISLPIGIIASIYLCEYQKESKFKRILEVLINTTSGVPSIIFGFCGAIIFIPFCNGVFGSNGYSLIAGAFTLCLIILPTIIKTTMESLKVIPRSYTMASLALGASKTQTVFKVILPNAISGILTSTLLSIGRIVGESAALIFVMGATITDKVSLNGQSTTLATHIWSIMQGENPNYSVACAIAIYILIIVLLLSIFVKLLSRKLNKMKV